MAIIRVSQRAICSVARIACDLVLRLEVAKGDELIVRPPRSKAENQRPPDELLLPVPVPLLPVPIGLRPLSGKVDVLVLEVVVVVGKVLVLDEVLGSVLVLCDASAIGVVALGTALVFWSRRSHAAVMERIAKAIKVVVVRIRNELMSGFLRNWLKKNRLLHCLLGVA